MLRLRASGVARSLGRPDHRGRRVRHPRERDRSARGRLVRVTGRAADGPTKLLLARFAGAPGATAGWGTGGTGVTLQSSATAAPRSGTRSPSAATRSSPRAAPRTPAGRRPSSHASSAANGAARRDVRSRRGDAERHRRRRHVGGQRRLRGRRRIRARRRQRDRRLRWRLAEPVRRRSLPRGWTARPDVRARLAPPGVSFVRRRGPARLRGGPRGPTRRQGGHRGSRGRWRRRDACGDALLHHRRAGMHRDGRRWRAGRPRRRRDRAAAAVRVRQDREDRRAARGRGLPARGQRALRGERPAAGQRARPPARGGLHDRPRHEGQTPVRRRRRQPRRRGRRTARLDHDLREHSAGHPPRVRERPIATRSRTSSCPSAATCTASRSRARPTPRS